MKRVLESVGPLVFIFCLLDMIWLVASGITAIFLGNCEAYTRWALIISFIIPLPVSHFSLMDWSGCRLKIVKFIYVVAFFAEISAFIYVARVAVKNMFAEHKCMSWFVTLMVVIILVLGLLSAIGPLTFTSAGFIWMNNDKQQSVRKSPQDSERVEVPNGHYRQST